MLATSILDCVIPNIITYFILHNILDIFVSFNTIHYDEAQFLACMYDLKILLDIEIQFLLYAILSNCDAWHCSSTFNLIGPDHYQLQHIGEFCKFKGARKNQVRLYSLNCIHSNISKTATIPVPR